MSKFKMALTSVAVLSTALLFSACGSDKAEQKQSANAKSEHKSKQLGKNNVVTFCLSNTFSDIEPGTTYSIDDTTNIRFVSEGLFGFAKDTAGTSNVLATSYDVSDDNLTYTFHLRKGVKWHTTKDFTPSREFNADDAVFSFNRQLHKNHPFYQKKYVFMAGLGLTEKVIKDVKKVDDYTMQIVLHKPMATLVSNLSATWIFGMVSKEYYEKMKNEGRLEFAYRHPVGTGPWIYVDNHTGEYTRYKSNPDYWGDKNKIEYLVVKAITDPSQYLNAVEEGECDVTKQLDASAIVNDAEKRYKNVALHPRHALTTWYLMLNHNANPALGNKLVRQAFAYAIDKDRIIKLAYSGQGIPAKSFIPPEIFGNFANKMSHYKYDLAKAKKLLAKAGYPNGKGIPAMKYLFSPNLSQERPTALIIQDNLKALGIKVTLVSISHQEFKKLTKAGQYDMGTTAWIADFPDPDNFYANRLGDKGNSNLANWKNDKFLHLIKEAVKYSNMDKRLKLYEKAAENFADQMPVIPLVHPSGYYATSKHLHGYYSGPVENSRGISAAYKD